eukprot:283632-Prorocentrum_minimum.AAC.2
MKTISQTTPGVRAGVPEGREVFETFEHMRQHGLAPNKVTYTLVVETFVEDSVAKTEEGNLELDTGLAIEFLKDLTAGAHRKYLPFVHNKLAQALALKGRWHYAGETVDRMLAAGWQPTLTTFNLLLGVYGKAGKWERAADTFALLEQCEVTSKTNKQI